MTTSLKTLLTNISWKNLVMIYLPNLLKPGSFEWNAFFKLHDTQVLSLEDEDLTRFLAKICTVYMILKLLNSNLTRMVRRFCNMLQVNGEPIGIHNSDETSVWIRVGKFVKISYPCMCSGTRHRKKFFMKQRLHICALIGRKRWTAEAGELKSAVTNLATWAKLSVEYCISLYDIG
jgi:hypothetical protein